MDGNNKTKDRFTGIANNFKYRVVFQQINQS